MRLEPQLLERMAGRAESRWRSCTYRRDAETDSPHKLENRNGPCRHDVCGAMCSRGFSCGSYGKSWCREIRDAGHPPKRLTDRGAMTGATPLLVAKAPVQSAEQHMQINAHNMAMQLVQYKHSPVRQARTPRREAS
jgi:hypothetical protein